jgi:hypothetical protein
MSLMGCAAEPTEIELVVTKPPRLNFAGVCLWCGERDCERRRCVELHAGSVWVVCDECNGFAAGECTCAHGVMEATPITLSGGS